MMLVVAWLLADVAGAFRIACARPVVVRCRATNDEPRSGGRSGGRRMFPDTQQTGGAGDIARDTLQGASLGAIGVWGATLGWCALHPPEHSWITGFVCFAGASSGSLPIGIIAGLVRTKAVAIRSGAVRSTTERAWSTVVSERGDVAFADTVERALNTSEVASRLVDEFVKGAGSFGVPARFVASFFFPPLDAALSRVNAQIARQYRRRAFEPEDRRRVAPVVGSAVEGMVARLIDDNITLAALLGSLLVAGSEGAILLLDALLPH